MPSPALLVVSDSTYSSRCRSTSLLPPPPHIRQSSEYLSTGNPYQHHLRHHRSQPHFPVVSTLGRPATPRRPSALDFDHGSRPSHYQAFAPFASPSSSKIISSSSLLPSSSSSSPPSPSPHSSDILHHHEDATYAHGLSASPPLSPIDLDADSDTYSETKSRGQQQRRLRRSSFAFIKAAVTPRIKHEHEHRSRTAEALDMDFACCGLGGFVHQDSTDRGSSDELPRFRCYSDITVLLEGVIQGDVLGLGFGIGMEGVEGMEVGLDYSDKESSCEETMGGCDPMGSGHRQERWTRSWTRWKGKTFPVFKGRSESALDGIGIGGDSSEVEMMACRPNVTKRRSKMWCLASWREMENVGLGPKSRVVHHGQRVRGASAQI